MRALLIETTPDNTFRAVIFNDEDGYKRVDQIAESDDIDILQEWFGEQELVTHVIHQGELEAPDCLTVWEAACASAGV